MTSAARRPLTIQHLRDLHARGEPIAMLTCYDATFARVLDAAGVDCLLIGDSLGMVLQGESSTLPVTLADTAYHVRSVARGNRSAFIVGDLPFGSYQESPSQAMRSAAVLMEAGAQMVKLEGGGWTNETVRFLTERGVPVCAHLGLTPQTVHALGGYRVQGRGEAGVLLKRHAIELAEAGAAMVLMELVPAPLAREVTEALSVPTIGIGAGAGCSGQVLVLHDMLGLPSGHGKPPRFVRDFMEGAGSIDAAVRRYVADVKSRAFPDDSIHSHA